MTQRALLPALRAVVFTFLATLLPTALVAQEGFDFDEEEVDTFGEPMEFDEDEAWGTEDEWGTDDGWGADEGTTGTTTPAAPQVSTVTGLFVPGTALAPELADLLTQTLLTELGTIEGYQTVGNDALRTEFEIMGADLAYECAFDPVCLGRYGRQLGLGKIVVGRVEAARDGGWETTIDLVDAATSTIENYRFFTTPARLADVQTALVPQLRLLFGLRPIGAGGGNVRSGPSPVQRGMAWTTLGLGVASIGAGVAFGLQANSIRNELEDCALVETAGAGFVCEITQTAARDRIDDGKKAALLSNVFLGTGLFLSAGSIVLFTVTPGGDIDEDADLASAPREFRVRPVVSHTQVGLSGSIRF